MMKRTRHLPEEQVQELAQLLYYSKASLRTLDGEGSVIPNWKLTSDELKEEWYNDVRWFVRIRPDHPQVLFYRSKAYMLEQGWRFGEAYDYDNKVSPALVNTYAELSPRKKLELELFLSICDHFIRYTELENLSSQISFFDEIEQKIKK